MSPEFLIIGTKRGGTTSLFNYLILHPGILGMYPRTRGQKSTDYFFRHHDSGRRWYQSNFHARAFKDLLSHRLGYQPLSFEASPYYMWDPRVAKRAQEINPAMKAIALLRNPVDRAFSHWQERTANGVEPLSFEDALMAEDARVAGERDRMLSDQSYHSDAHDWYTYRERGIYLPQLENWKSVFPARQLLVLRSEDMYRDVQGTFDRVCDFLGLPRMELPTTRAFNASSHLPIPSDAREYLEDFYAPLSRDLERNLGHALEW